MTERRFPPSRSFEKLVSSYGRQPECTHVHGWRG
jgi:hypothetical protein